jgi:translation initiation factor IF-2
LEFYLTAMNTEKTQMIERPPIVAIMGHIDHGKSTLLSYIRKNIKPLNEAGGITQHISAYEVLHISKEGKKNKITFLDTPGHEAFKGIRSRGAQVADVAVLVVSAEDGVKPQTLEALSSLQNSKTPFIVAINKIDKPGADIEKTKNSLVENQIYIEGYGGDIPCVAISSKTGQGVPELLDMIILVAEVEGLTGDPIALGQGVIIESNRDIKKGISATCIVKNGHLEKGLYVASGQSFAPIRMMENYLGESIDRATLSEPVKIIGWNILPEVGDTFQTYKTRDEAFDYIEKNKNNSHPEEKIETTSDNFFPIIVKADTGSSLEAVLYEIKKLGKENIVPFVISSGIGSISEKDAKLANGEKKAIIIGFNVKTDSTAKSVAERNETEIKNFDIIYKLTEWLAETLIKNTPKVKVQESLGQAKILKVFSKVKDKQILGGKVLGGSIKLGAQVKIMRRGEEIAQGKIRELQQQKNKTDEIKEGIEFGTMIEAKMEIAQGDIIDSFIIVEK